MPQLRNTYCPVCAHLMKKNGTTSKGSIRWRCTHCGMSLTRKRKDITHAAQFDAFITWITGNQTQREACSTGSDRTWRYQTQWCWNVQPVIPITGEIYDYIQIDGTYLPYDWCLLTAASRGKVLAFQWCNRENTEAYKSLLNQLPTPVSVITDGHPGALSAIKQVWPGARVQRCLVHIKRNIRVLTTMNPRIPAHQALWGLAKKLVTIKMLQEADNWVNLLQKLYDQWKNWLNQRTFRRNVSEDNIPSWVRMNQQWWYTHQKARRAYRLLTRQLRDGTLFAFLDPVLREQVTAPIPSNTNALEGGINSQIKRLINTHKGLSEDHMRRAIEWWCYLNSEHPGDPKQFITPECFKPKTKKIVDDQHSIGPARFDTSFDLYRIDYYPDISIRKGTIR